MGLLDKVLGQLFKGRQWIRVWAGAVVFFSIAMIACGLALQLTQDEHAFFGRRGWNQAFAISELSLLMIYMGAFVSLFRAVTNTS
jgi:hypothetical protein